MPGKGSVTHRATFLFMARNAYDVIELKSLKRNRIF